MANGAVASTAFRLAGIALMPERDEMHPPRLDAWRAGQRAWQDKLVAGVLSLPDDVIVELRYLAIPRERGASDIEVAVVVHANGIDTGDARRACTEAAGQVSGLLEMNRRICEFARITTENDLRQLLCPFTSTATVEIRRTCRSLQRRRDRSPAGFARVRQQTTGQRLSMPPSIDDGSPHSSLLAFCHVLSQQTVPTLVCIQLGACLAGASRAAARFVDDLSGANDDWWALDEMSGTRRLDPGEGEELVQRARELRDRQPRSVRVAVASEGSISGVLAGIVGSELLSPATDRAVTVPFAGAAERVFRLGPMSFDPVDGDDLSVAFTPGEITRVFALPMAGQLLPGLPNLRSHLTHVPSGLPESGRVLGRKRTASDDITVCAPADSPSPHYYVLGQSSVGKSTLLGSMALSDIRAGAGVGVIDPHGDLVDFLLPRIPDDRLDDVVLIDPADREHPVGLNLLEVDDEDGRDFVCGEFMKMVQKLWDPKLQEPMAFGPMYNQAMRAAALTVMSFPERGTIVDIPRLFEDRAYLKARLKMIDDPGLRGYWEQTWEDTDKRELRPYVTSKVEIFRQNRTIRRIVGQRHSTVDVRDLIDAGKIVLLKLSIGRLGLHDAAFLGSVLVTRILAAVMSRADLPASTRRRFNLYIDEFQVFTTDSIGLMVSQARKYGLALVLAHQNLRQLSEHVRDEVLGNVGQIIAFRPGPPDVDLIQRYFEPTFSTNDLLALPNWTAAARLFGRSGPLTPFTFQTVVDSEPASEARAERIRELSRERYGRPRPIVEAEISRRLTAKWCDGRFEGEETSGPRNLLEVAG